MFNPIRRLLTVAGIAALSMAALAQSPSKGVVRVKLQSEVAQSLGTETRRSAPGKMRTTVSALDASLKQIKGTELRPVIPPNPKYAAERAKYGIDRWYEIVFDESVDAKEAARILGATPGVERASARVPMTLYDSGKYRVFDPSKAAKASSATPFNDPRLANQWHYYNDGSMTSSKAGSDINLYEAWKVTTGSPDVIVAIIDGGIDIEHEDLVANLLINEAELNGTTGVDNDNNGYIDDVYGWNFCTNSAVIYAHDHGTHVAGTVAAVNNNGIGVAGVAGGDGSKNSGIRMLSCQVFDSRSGTGEGDFAAALIYAAERGATIAQCSWGWSLEDYYEQDVLDAIRYFTNMARSEKMTGGLCIFAAGNDGATGNYYPGCMSEVLTVASMDAAKTPTYYSNYGSWVDVTAPGGLMDYGDNWGVLSTLPGNSYGWNEGTSMACPHVSGIAALVLSKYGSTAMTTDLLRTQLESAVNDLYATNPTLEGLYGSGYIDAAKALQFGEDEAPAAVSDLVLVPAQDNITLEWTIPAASFDNVHHHIVYYSTEEFTADSDLAKLNKAVVDTKFNSSGDKVTHTIEGLASLTKYYVAIQAVSRYGTTSELSPVISASTNAGPKMTVDKKSLTIKNSNGNMTTASFNIGNDDEGLLRWSYRTTTTKATLATASLAPAFVPVPYAGTMGAEKAARVTNVVSDEYVRDEYPRTFEQFEYLYAYIGDTDLKVSNSMAQNFTVDASTYPDGFNLTAVNISGKNGKNPLIEVYKGSTAFSAADCLYSARPSYFYYGGNLSLSEQLYFAPGESFWIVVHFDAADQENLYPLGIAEGYTSAASNALMSNDLGKTWTRLSEALAGTSYASLSNVTWTIRAVSNNPDWSQLVTLTPASGTVKQGETQNVVVSTDGQKMVNGTYGFNIYFDTNETDANTLKIPVTLTVSDMEPKVSFNKVVNFGSLLVGESKKMTVEIFNSGYGNFSGSKWSAGIYSDKISSSSEHFTGPDYLSSGIPARSTVTFDITYAPTTDGSHSGVISLTDKDGRVLKIMVQGVATQPARLTVEPSTIEVGDLEVGGEKVEKEFTIKNDGQYPLHYAFPKFSDEQIEGSGDSDVHKFGYLWTSNLNGSTGFEYDGNPALVGATDITSTFNDNTWWSGAISTGFTFPYYGKEYSRIYITSYGGFAIQPYEGSMGQWPLYPGHSYVLGTGMVSAFGGDLKVGPKTVISYGKQDGNLVISYKDILACVYDTEYTPISFRVVLCPSGDIKMYYDDLDGAGLFQSNRGIYVGINDLDDEDPLTVTSTDIANPSWADEDSKTVEGEYYKAFGTGTAVRFIAPAANIVESIEPASALVAPGETVTVKAVLAAGDNMNAGTTTTNLVVNSNDLREPSILVPFTANITGDLQPEFKLGSESVDFGDVFRTSEASSSLTLRNTGRSSLTVSTVTLRDNKVSVALELPAVIAAGQAKDLVITLPTENEGAVSDLVTIVTDAGTLTAPISGNVIGCPGIELGYENIELTIDANNKQSFPLTIKNTGNEDLTYSVVGASHVLYNPDYDNADNVGYSYEAAVDNSDVSFEWIDIVTDGRGEQNNFSYYLAHDYVEVQLPFSFPFYGEKYDKMYIYNVGFVSFTKRTDEKAWPEPPADFPGGTIYNNMIAPYWGLHSMDQTKTAGTYHYETDDYAVISFMEYGNSMNLGVCFQLILYKDGSFKYQYRADENNDYSVIYSTFGLNGISDTNNKGMRLPDRYVAFNNAVEFSPVVEFTLAPGKEATADVAISADVMKGEYTTSITVNTNVPGKEKIQIPVSMTVNGQAKAVFPEDITESHPAGWASTDYTDPMIQMGAAYAPYVVIKNEGTAPFTITGVDNNGPTVYDDWFDEYSPMFTTFVYDAELDWMTGEPTGNYYWGQYGGQSITVTSQTKFCVPMLPYSEAHLTPGTYEIPLVFHIDGVEGVETKTVTVKYVVTNPPAMSLEQQEVRVEGVAPFYEGTIDFNIANLGTGALEGTAYIDLTGVGESSGNDYGIMAPKKVAAELPEAMTALQTAIQPREVAESSESILDLPAKTDADFIRGLYYPVMPNQKTTYNYGSGKTYDTYKAATAFTSPAEGFNIAKIYTIMKIGSITDKDLTVEIKTGGVDGKTVGTGKYHISSVSNTEASYQIVITLDRAVYIPAGQEFHVVITYPLGEAWPTTLCVKEESVVTERYLGWTESYDWFDVASLFKEQYGSLGYVMSCLETETGHSWVELASDGSVFTIDPAKTATLKLNVLSNAAPLESDNMAMLVIKTNDPASQIVNVPVYLSKNGTPRVSAGADNILIDEGNEAQVTFTVTEPDNDDVTLTLDDNGGVSKIAGVTGGEAVIAEDGASATVTKVEDALQVLVTIAPKRGDIGNYNVTLSASDVHYQEGQATTVYTVAHVNSAPEAVAYADILIDVDGVSPIVNFGDLFTDADGDDLVYTFTVADGSVIEAYATATSAMFVGLKPGESTVTVTATDPSGASATNTVKVVVSEKSGVNDIVLSTEVKVWPNPVVDRLNITLGGNVATAELSLVAMNGAAVYSETVTNCGSAHHIDVANLPTGAYVLRIVANGSQASYVIVKN